MKTALITAHGDPNEEVEEFITEKMAAFFTLHSWHFTYAMVGKEETLAKIDEWELCKLGGLYRVYHGCKQIAEFTEEKHARTFWKGVTDG